VEIRSQKLSDFFNIGRDLGWDVEQQRWTVRQLTSPEAQSHTIGDIIEGGLPPELPLVKSGNRYGYPPLRERIVETFDYELDKDHVLMTLGTQMSNYIAMTSLLEPGDEAIVETPSWEQPRVLCQALKVGCKLLRRREELDWQFDLDELKSLMSPKVKLLYICHPNNPTGACLSRDRLQAVCDIAAGQGAYVLADEIYRGMEWSGELSPSVANTYERGVATGSISKILGLSGTRLGWLATPDRDFLERCMELKYYITLHQQSRLDETIAMAALERQKFWSLARASMTAGRRNYDVVARWMKSNGTFHWVPPAGGFLSFPHYDLDLPSWDLCVTLLEEPYRTYVIPGSCYGYEHHIRLGFGPDTPPEDVTDGLAQISRLVDDYKSGRAEVEISGH
jgi:aspartate/methionine/tyrosine aminotransferase